MLITLLDVILIVIMLISGFLALMRGFTREVLSIASWAAAAVAAVLAYSSELRPMVRAEFSQPLIGDAILVIGVFLLVLLIVSLITARISDAILDSRIGALDRSAGFLFGLFRGLVIVVIGYLFFNWLVQEEKQPGWVREARALPVLKSTGNWILAQLPSDPEATINELKNRRNQTESPDATEMPDGETPDDDNPAAAEPQSNYTTDEQEQMDDLTETPQESAPQEPAPQ